ncbi:MAG: hypothetical protein IJ325_10600 [Clostridia bacterium]|nr:hypothetical protein [Clostridia bacterium]
MKNFSFKRLTAWLLTLVMLVGVMPLGIVLPVEAASDSETIYVLAGGDFQEAGDHANSAENVTNILAQISKNYDTMDGFLFIGDYDCETHDSATETANGITALMGAVQGSYSNLVDSNSVLVQGNHDYMDSRIDATGGHEFDGYSAYVLNEDDYPNGGGSQSGVQTLANNLKTWLTDKIGEGYSAPIFIVSHLPLAFTPRTVTQGDAKYAKYIFDVLNDAAANGLNIIFLHGHDHAYGPDNYMGGEAIYLPVGDKICIAEAGSTSAWTEETLNFTYMNAGYTGYYSDAYTYVTTAGTDKLTMTVFAITDNQVTVERYSEDGLYNLKSAGYDGSYSNTSVDNISLGLPKYDTVYASPQTITLSEAQDYGSTIGEWVGVEAETTDDVTVGNEGWVELIAPKEGGTTYTYTQANSITAGEEYVIVASNAAVALQGTTSMGTQGVTIEGTTMTSTVELTEWTISGTGNATVYNGSRYLRYNNGMGLSTYNNSVYIVDNGDDFIIKRRQNNTGYALYYNDGWTTSDRNTAQYVRLYQLTDTTTTEEQNGTYGKVVGKLSYDATVGMTADEAMALVKAGIDGYYYEAMSTPGSDVTGTIVDDSVLTWEWVDTFDGNTAGDYEVAIKYGDFLLGTAEVIVPATTTYYIAEGNGLYLVDMNTTEANALAAVKAGITVYSATDLNGTGKTAISDDDVTWNWVDKYNGADSGPYTVEILKDGTSLGTVEVKVNVKYETGINSDWTYIGESEATGGTHTYTLDTDGIDADGQYIIVAESQALALHTSGSSAATAISVTISSDGKTLTTDTRDYEYYWNSTYGFTRDGYNGLYQSSWAIYLGEKSASYLDGVVNHNNGTYTLYDNEGNIRGLTYSGGWTVAGDEDTYTDYKVRLYKYTGTTGGTSAGSIYAKIEGNTVYTVDQGTSSTQALAAVKAGITGYISNSADGSTPTAIDDSLLTWKWKNTYTGNYTGSYWVEISYDGKVLGTVEVQVVPAVIDDYPDYPNEGAVKVNKTAIYTDEDFRKTGVAQVELSVSGVPSKKGVDVVIMLDTSSSMETWCVCGTQNCTSTGTGHARRSAVLEESLSNLVTLFKTPGDDGELLDIQVAIADFNGFYGDNHNASGTAYDRDAADMMSDDIYYNANSEAQVYTGDGTLTAGAFIDVADLASSYTLNYTSGTNYDYAMDAIYQLASAKQDSNFEDRDLFVIFLSDGAPMQWNYYHSQGNSSLWNNWITGAWSSNQLTTTNLNCTTHAYYYDEVDHDGDGQLNEHRMANAIKGAPTEQFEVIRKTNTLGTATDETNMYMVPGLGATMFAISFGAQDDGNVTKESMHIAIDSLASPEDDTSTPYHYHVTSADELTSAFNSIGTEIAYAANNARFVDQMGEAFDLQLTQSVTREVDGTPITLDVKPTITVKTYDIYTKAEADADPNDDITTDMIGTRKGTYKVLETVSFTDDGEGTVTGAYSDQINSGNTNILADGTQTGFYKNVIYAKTFVYNNNKDGTYAYLDTDGDGIEDYALAPETFYWKVGTVTTTELAISYYVYLTDTMNGERAPGSYATNNFAILYYDNYLGNECEIHTVSPMLAWKQANVSYAFYLVNKDGEVIVDRKTGATGTFANRIAVTRPVVYDYCYLNTESTIEARTLSVAESTVLPDGYTIYDTDAAYNILVLSDDSDTKAGWTISKSNSVATASTYVTGFYSDVQYSNALTEHNTAYDYTHTTVWFAVVWVPSTIPDQVVVDYGLPVDISVLENDLFETNNRILTGIGLTNPVAAGNISQENHDTSFGTSLSMGENGLSYGTAVISDEEVRYSPADMQMDGYDKFVYEVQYTINNETQYYYGDVTVIPATTIYYEESFVTFTPASRVTVNSSGTVVEGSAVEVKAGEMGYWSKVGTASSGTTQDEDRPGKSSVATIDRDNIYGYDGVYNSITEYSLGTAMQVTVGDSEKAADGSYTTTGYNGYAPKASFTFTGSGFDIISLTDSDAGAIIVTVKQGDTVVKTSLVANYYGMSYEALKNEDGSPQVDEAGNTVYGWVPTENGAIWQVPVIKMTSEDLGGYGTYTVEIQLVYLPMFDLGTNPATQGQYNFVLDAIRIYDPANGGAADGNNADGTPDTTIEDAYAADGESNPRYLLIKEAILDAASADTLYSNGDEGNGVVFIDGIPEATKVDDYKNPGPNNEAYLAPGQSISFKLKANATPLEVHVGAKLANGTSADVMFTYTGTTGSDSKVRTFDTATDMYYPITDYLGLVQDNQFSTTAVAWTSGTITLTNVSEDAIVSLTNIKATFYLSSVGDTDGGTFVQSKSTSTGTFSFLTAQTNAYSVSSLTTTDTTAEPVAIAFLVDADVIEDACSVMNALYAPAPEITVPEVFVPEVLEYTVTSGFFGTNTVTVITSQDVASLTVNGIEAQNLNSSRMFSSMLKMISNFEKTFGINFSSDEYYLWTVTTKRADSYDIVAFNEDGLSSDASVTDSYTSITEEDITGFFDRSEVFGVMEELARQSFSPEYFESYFNERLDGKREIITHTSEDVDYVMIEGEIVDRYITKTVIDIETGEETQTRVWIADAEDKTEDEVEVNAYDEKGVSSDSKKAEHKRGFKFDSQKNEDTESDSGNNRNNGNSNSYSKNNGKNNNKNWKKNSGKNVRM